MLLFDLVCNLDLQHIVTPIDVNKFIKLLDDANYDRQEILFLKKGFTKGFSIGYQGSTNRQDTFKNIPFTIGDKFDMWEKIMKKEGAGRYAGAFTHIPFKHYIQSPVGIVPKAGNKTRLIFHLSYVFPDNINAVPVNSNTPKELCTVKYNDFDSAVKSCLKVSGEAVCKNQSRSVFLSKSDLMSAFRMIPIAKENWCWLILKAEDPRDGTMKFFVDKCLPFGASISCSHFQRFSNSLRFLVEYITGKKLSVINYLDDFLFIDISEAACNAFLSQFLQLCQEIRLPVALDKTEWACEKLVFLGIMLDGKNLMLRIPPEKRDRALTLLNYFTGKKKATVKQLQVLTGYLNFLTKAIFPGRAFTRRIYAKYAKVKDTLRNYHHVRLDQEFKFDIEVWRIFLSHNMSNVVNRPMLDIEQLETAQELEFYSDASANPSLGYWAVYQNHWIFNRWELDYIQGFNPSIEYLELFALTTAVLTWGKFLRNKRVIVF